MGVGTVIIPYIGVAYTRGGGYIGSPLDKSYAEFFHFMLQFLCLQMCVYGSISFFPFSNLCCVCTVLEPFCPPYTSSFRSLQESCFVVCKHCKPRKSFWPGAIQQHMELKHPEEYRPLDPNWRKNSLQRPKTAQKYLAIILESAENHAKDFVQQFHDHREKRGQPRCSKDGCICNPMRPDVATIHTYTQQSPIFKDCNLAMRTSLAAEWKPYITRLSCSLNALPTFKGTVYRGIASRVKKMLYLKDNLVVWHAFSSSSKSSAVAETFLAADNMNSTLFVIESKTGRLVSPLSAFEDEAEVVFPPNSVFRVMGDLSQGVLELLSQAMKRDLQQVKCFNLLEVVNFESGLTVSEWRQLEPLILRLQMKKNNIRRRDSKYSQQQEHMADKTVAHVFDDCLRQYPGPMRLLAHEYGPAHVLYVALVKLRTYHHTGRPPSKPGRVAAEVLVDLLVRMGDTETFDDIDPVTTSNKSFTRRHFLEIFHKQARKMHDIYAIQSLRENGLLPRLEDDMPQWIAQAVEKLVDIQMHKTTSMRTELLNSDDTIDRRSASSGEEQQGTEMGKLDSKVAWKAATERDEWYQILLKRPTQIRGIVTQGSGTGDFVSEYKVRVQTETEAAWTSVTALGGGDIFQGNKSGVGSMKAVALFSEPVTVVAVRILPQRWEGHISLRAALLNAAANDQVCSGGAKCSASLKQDREISAGAEFRQELFGVVKKLFKSTGVSQVTRDTCPVPCAKDLQHVLSDQVFTIDLAPLARGPLRDGTLKMDQFVFQVSSFFWIPMWLPHVAALPPSAPSPSCYLNSCPISQHSSLFLPIPFVQCTAFPLSALWPPLLHSPCGCMFVHPNSHLLF